MNGGAHYDSGRVRDERLERTSRRGAIKPVLLNALKPALINKQNTFNQTPEKKHGRFCFCPRCGCLQAAPRRRKQTITVDRFLVQGVNEVAWILYGVLEVADGVRAAAFTPQALL